MLSVLVVRSGRVYGGVDQVPELTSFTGRAVCARGMGGCVLCDQVYGVWSVTMWSVTRASERAGRVAYARTVLHAGVWSV